MVTVGAVPSPEPETPPRGFSSMSERAGDRPVLRERVPAPAEPSANYRLLVDAGAMRGKRGTAVSLL